MSCRLSFLGRWSTAVAARRDRTSVSDQASHSNYCSQGHIRRRKQRAYLRMKFRTLRFDLTNPDEAQAYTVSVGSVQRHVAKRIALCALALN